MQFCWRCHFFCYSLFSSSSYFPLRSWAVWWLWGWGLHGWWYIYTTRNQSYDLTMWISTWMHTLCLSQHAGSSLLWVVLKQHWYTQGGGQEQRGITGWLESTRLVSTKVCLRWQLVFQEFPTAMLAREERKSAPYAVGTRWQNPVRDEL